MTKQPGDRARSVAAKNASMEFSAIRTISAVEEIPVSWDLLTPESLDDMASDVISHATQIKEIARAWRAALTALAASNFGQHGE